MAEYALIDGYLEAFRTQVRWRKDVEDLVAEVEDHLYSTVERFEARGTDAQLAQRQTLDRFGDPDLMAEAFASAPRGGIAMPTKFTVTAGFAGLWAAVFWVAAAAIYWLGHAFDFDNTGVYLIWTGAILAGGGLTTWATEGLRQRLGGLGALGLAGFVILAIGVAVSFMSWALPLWMTIQGVGMLLVALAAWPMRVAPKLPLIAYGSGMLIGSAAFIVLNLMKVGSPDSYGDYPVAWGGGLTIGLVIVAVALLGLGRWLRIEQPAEIDTTPDEAITT